MNKPRIALRPYYGTTPNDLVDRCRRGRRARYRTMPPHHRDDEDGDDNAIAAPAPAAGRRVRYRNASPLRRSHCCVPGARAPAALFRLRPPPTAMAARPQLRCPQRRPRLPRRLLLRSCPPPRCLPRLPAAPPAAAPPAAAPHTRGCNSCGCALTTRSPAAAPAAVHRAPLPVAAPPTAPPIQTVPTSARSAQRTACSAQLPHCCCGRRGRPRSAVGALTPR